MPASCGFEHRGYDQRDEMVMRVNRVGMLMLKPKKGGE